MKKILAILLALGLILVSFAAMAENLPEVPVNVDEVFTETADADETPEYYITKTYTSNVSGLYPVETLEFEVTKGNNSNPAITVANYSVDGSSDTYKIPVVVPEASVYGTAGVYKYTVKEKTPTTPSQGVEYDTGDEGTVFNVDVYVYFENTAAEGEAANIQLVRKAVIYSGASPSADTKKETFENEYSVGQLTVSKTIAGNLAHPEKVFTIVITLTSTNNVASDITIDNTNATSATGETTKGWKTKTITATLKGGQSVVISNIPTGVTYTVKETGINDIPDDDTAAQITNANDQTYYAIKYDGTGTSTNEDEATDGTTGTISTTASTATVTNTKNITVPTGITLDFVPYVMIIALAGIALVAMKARKKEY